MEELNEYRITEGVRTAARLLIDDVTAFEFADGEITLTAPVFYMNKLKDRAAALYGCKLIFELL